MCSKSHGHYGCVVLVELPVIHIGEDYLGNELLSKPVHPDNSQRSQKCARNTSEVRS